MRVSGISLSGGDSHSLAAEGGLLSLPGHRTYMTLWDDIGGGNSYMGGG